MEKKSDANENLTVTIMISESPQDVFERITRDVAKWWGGKDLKGKSVNLGDEFIIYHADAHYSKQQLIEVISNKRIVWLVNDSTLYWLKNDQQEWTNTKMIFEINTQGDKTTLCFTHAGLTPQKECYNVCEHGWNLVIKDYLFNLITCNKPHF